MRAMSGGMHGSAGAAYLTLGDGGTITAIELGTLPSMFVLYSTITWQRWR
jgi:hypothetical protein